MTFNKLKNIQNSDFKQLYKLLKKLEFPYLPNNIADVTEALNKPYNHLIGGYFNDKLVMFLCFSEQNCKLYFDIAVAEEYQKHWASKKMLNFIYNYAFNVLGFDEMYTESFSKTAQKTVLKAGFNKVEKDTFMIRFESSNVQKYLIKKEERLKNE